MFQLGDMIADGCSNTSNHQAPQVLSTHMVFQSSSVVSIPYCLNL